LALSCSEWTIRLLAQPLAGEARGMHLTDCGQAPTPFRSGEISLAKHVVTGIWASEALHYNTWSKSEIFRVQRKTSIRCELHSANPAPFSNLEPYREAIPPSYGVCFLSRHSYPCQVYHGRWPCLGFVSIRYF
jgi:hypothetical protein